MRHPMDCEGDFDKIEPLKIFGSLKENFTRINT